MESKHVNHCVECKVTDCVYHGEHNVCTASKITVGPEHAQSSAETLCSTFRSADCCNHCK